MQIKLKPIRQRRVSDQVFEQLKDLIFRGTLKPGDKVLPERELADALNVSRTSVRNAINKLVTLGYLQHKQGQGTFVRSSVGFGSNPFALAFEDPEHLVMVRQGDLHFGQLVPRFLPCPQKLLSLQIQGRKKATIHCQLVTLLLE